MRAHLDPPQKEAAKQNDRGRMQVAQRNVWLLAFCQALRVSQSALLIAVTGLVGARLAEDPSWATLPLALSFLSTMVATIPAAWTLQRFGFKASFVAAAALGCAGASVCILSVASASFVGLCLGTTLIGTFNAYSNYYRFVAADQSPQAFKSKAISYVMAGGVAAAFIGPNLGRVTQHWLTGPEFLGSFVAVLGLGGLIVLGSVGLRLSPIQLHDRRAPEGEGAQARSVSAIARQPKFIVAAVGGVFGYSIMTLLMTATPLAMQQHQHPFWQTASVIQWHVFAMFAPSFFTGHLIRRLGASRVMFAGALLDLLCVTTNLNGHTFVHYWLSLFALGLGWNFLFIGATAMLTETYRPEERAKAQASNDFLISTSVALASFSAGAVQNRLGWETANWIVLPGLTLVVLALAWLQRVDSGPARVTVV